MGSILIQMKRPTENILGMGTLLAIALEVKRSTGNGTALGSDGKGGLPVC